MIFRGSRMMNFALIFLGCINILLHLILYTHLIDVFPLMLEQESFDSSKPVTSEDIRSVFENLAKKKKQRLS